MNHQFLKHVFLKSNRCGDHTLFRLGRSHLECNGFCTPYDAPQISFQNFIEDCMADLVTVPDEIFSLQEVCCEPNSASVVM